MGHVAGTAYRPQSPTGAAHPALSSAGARPSPQVQPATSAGHGAGHALYLPAHPAKGQRP